MTKPKDEGYFFVDGQKSPIHCVVRETDTSGNLTDIHYHTYIEILYGVDCDMKIWIDGEFYPLKSGDICCINQKKPHFVYSDREQNEHFCIKFSPEMLLYGGQTAAQIKFLSSVITNNKSINCLISKNEIDKEMVDSLMKDIRCEWEDKGIGYELALRGNILRLFCFIIRAIENRKQLEFSQGQTDELSQIINDAVNYTSKNFATVTENDIAKRFHMSYSYFSRIFKKVMGKSFTSYVNELKLEESKRMLLTTNKSVSQISAQVGFSGQSYFIAKFKQYTNMTPLQYKKSVESIFGE